MTSKQMTYKDSQLLAKELNLIARDRYREMFGYISNPPAQDTKPTMSESNEQSATQVGGSHYKKCEIQPWDYTIANDLDYFQGSIIKYVTRWKDKGWIQDLYKARHFLDKYIETMEKKHTQLTDRPT
jgi:hypothetical protein